jgi:type IV pilus assembly protein PilA
VITVRAQGISALPTAENTLTLVPFITDTAALANTNAGATIFKWRCGSTLDGTTIRQKYLPGSCRGQ